MNEPCSAVPESRLLNECGCLTRPPFRDTHEHDTARPFHPIAGGTTGAAGTHSNGARFSAPAVSRPCPGARDACRRKTARGLIPLPAGSSPGWRH